MIQDRLSFMRFLGFSLSDKAPDAKTILGSSESTGLAVPRASGASPAQWRPCSPVSTGTSPGPVIWRWAGRSSMPPSWRRPSSATPDGEKADIKAGKTAGEIWPDKPAKARQKDGDARWTVKVSKAKPAKQGKPEQVDIAVPAFGYKACLWASPEEPCRDRLPARLHPRPEGNYRAIRKVGTGFRIDCATSRKTPWPGTGRSCAPCWPRQYRLESVG